MRVRIRQYVVKETERKRTPSGVEPRLVALPVGEPPVRAAHGDVHDQVEVCVGGQFHAGEDEFEEGNTPWSNGVAFVPFCHGFCSAVTFPSVPVTVCGNSPRWKNGWLKGRSSSVCRRVSTEMRLRAQTC